MNIYKKKMWLLACNLAIVLTVSGGSLTDDQLQAIRNGYDTRRAEAFELLRGKALEREKVIPPIFSDGSDFSRHYSYSLMDYAFKCLWLGEQLDSANAALIENADYYIGYPRAYTDKDSFYWATDEMCKMLEFFGTNGSKKAGLIRPDVEERIFFMMWEYVKMQSKVAKTEWKESRTWSVEESENHHVQRFYAAWHFSKYLKDHPYYKDKIYNDDHTAAQHYEAWNTYIKEWIRERARKGLFVEMANDAYGLETLKGIYNFYDFGDTELRDLSRKLIDMYWAAWAQEQIDNVRGGAKTRLYPYQAAQGYTPFRKMAWYYLGTGEINAPYNNLFTLITSDYRMPGVVMDIALDTEGRGSYEIVQRRQGRSEGGFFTPPNYHLAQNGELLRYTYSTPEFMAGTLFCEALPYEDWVMISSQNRWAGVIFAGDIDARIFASCKTGRDNRCYNQLWSVQSRGAMIFHKLQDSLHSRGAYRMQLWVSKAGLAAPQTTDGWIFTESKGAYAAIKSMGSYTTEEADKGMWVVPDDPYTPIIVEVADKTDFADFETFRKKILTAKVSRSKTKATYSSINGDVLTLPLDYKGMPSVNGRRVELHPAKAMSSPFLNTVFDSGEVEISKDGRRIFLDFN